jgi:hypothetical protein
MARVGCGQGAVKCPAARLKARHELGRDGV